MLRRGRAGARLRPGQGRVTRRVVFAWLVHLYTATGAALAAWALLAVFAGDYRLTWVLISASIFIDSTDGVLARAAHVKTVLPGFDGRRLDDIVDYLCWVFVPVVFLVHAGMLPAWAAIAPLVASGYGFGQADAKTEDHYFLGFPSYWSIVAFILYEFAAPQAVTLPLILFLSVMVFVPIRYPYPSRMRVLRTPTILLGIPWSIIGLILVALLPERPRWLALLYCYYLVYYAGLTAYLAWRRRARSHAARRGAGSEVA